MANINRNKINNISKTGITHADFNKQFCDIKNFKIFETKDNYLSEINI